MKTSNLQTLFEQLESLYLKIPGVPCIAGCTGCCVSPTMTLVEYLYLIKPFLEHRVKDLQSLFQVSMREHPKFEGNYYCRFQTKLGQCGAHLSRAMACRMHGLPILEKLGVSNLENCTIMEKSLLPQVPKDEVTQWLEELMSLNGVLVEDYGDNFYSLIALNVESWTDIWLLDLSNEHLLELQNVLRYYLPVGNLKREYTSLSDICEKVERVSLLELLMATGDGGSVSSLLEQIMSDYPKSGTYFMEQGEFIREHLANLENNT